MGIWWDVTIIRGGFSMKPWNKPSSDFCGTPMTMETLKHSWNIVVPIIVIMKIINCRTFSNMFPCLHRHRSAILLHQRLGMCAERQRQRLLGEGPADFLGWFDERKVRTFTIFTMYGEYIISIIYIYSVYIYIYLYGYRWYIHVRSFNCGVTWHLFIDTTDTTYYSKYFLNLNKNLTVQNKFSNLGRRHNSNIHVLIYCAFIGQTCGTGNSWKFNSTRLGHIIPRLFSDSFPTTFSQQNNVFAFSKSWLFCGDAPKQKPSESWN
jgi:hypothetical protein